MKRCHRILQGILGCVVRPSTGSPPELGASRLREGCVHLLLRPCPVPLLSCGAAAAVQDVFDIHEGLGGEPNGGN